MGGFEFVAVVLALGAALQLASSETGVCTRTVSSTESFQVYVTSSSSYSYGCGIWNWKRCRRTRYRARLEVRTRNMYSTRHTCCAGYSGNGTKCFPICNNCMEPRICRAPNDCVCPPGWRGTQCSEDIDECQLGVCKYKCTNSMGSFQCICPDGAVLADNQRSCIESPQNITLTATNSTALTTTWDPPQLGGDDGVLEHYNISCKATDKAEPVTDTTTLGASVNSFIQASLDAATSYRCCVTAVTSKGISSPACHTATTLEDVPSGPPINVTVTNFDAFTITIQWNPPADPNGHILHYTIYSNGSPVANVSGTWFSVEGLSPYQQSNISVSASTKIGEGPQSEQMTIRTLQTAPSAVVGVDKEVLSPNMFRVSWLPPHSPNGVLTGYLVEVYNETNYAQPFINTSLHPNQLNINISTGIKPYVAYTVQISAVTIGGVGDSTVVVVFTLEAVPVKAPAIVLAERTEATAALVQWKLLSLKQLRGNLLSYDVVYYPLHNRDCPVESSTENKTVSETEGVPRTNLSHLLPGQRYCVTVAARTTAGVGNFSYKIIPLYDNSVFTIRLGLPSTDKNSCKQWTQEKTFEKLEALVQAVAKGTQLFCGCWFTSHYIAEGSLTCDLAATAVVVFRGRIVSTNRSSHDLVADLERWINTEPLVVIRGTELRVLSGKETNSERNGEAEVGVSVIAGTAGGAVVLLLLLLVALILVCVVPAWRKHRRVKVELTSTVATSSSSSSEAVEEEMKELSNPFYGYGTAERATTVDSSLYQQVDTAYGSPKYDEVGGRLRRGVVGEREKGGDVGGKVEWEELQVENPTYGVPTAPESALLMPEMSNPTYGMKAVPIASSQTPKKITTNPIYGMQLTTTGVLCGAKDSQQLTANTPRPTPDGRGPTPNSSGTTTNGLRSTPDRLEAGSGCQYSEVPAQTESFIYDAVQ